MGWRNSGTHYLLVGQAFDRTVTYDDYADELSINVQGSNPPGLSRRTTRDNGDGDDLIEATVRVYGTPTTVGTYVLDMEARIETSGTDGTFVSYSQRNVTFVVRDNTPATGTPAISGTAQAGRTLTVNRGSIEDADGRPPFPTEYSFQWRRNNVNISNATNRTYTLTSADVGASISVRVSFRDSNGNSEARTSGQTAAVDAANTPATGTPDISGTPTERQTLTANIGTISDADGLPSFPSGYSFRWLRNGVNISNATGQTYALITADVGGRISVRLSFQDSNGNSESRTSGQTAAVDAANSAATGTPAISGTAQAGEELTANLGTIVDADGLPAFPGGFTFQWLRSGVNIDGATDQTYTPTTADVGARISVRVSFPDNDGHNESRTSGQTAAVAMLNHSTGAPAISGTLEVGEELTANLGTIVDADGLPAFPGGFTFQWLRNGSVITGATGQTYTLTRAEEGDLISVRLSFQDNGGHDEVQTSAETDAIAVAPPNYTDGDIVATRLFSNKEIRAMASDGENVYMYDERNGQVVVVNSDLQQLTERAQVLVIAHPNGITWTEDGAEWTDVPVPGEFLALFDDRVWAIDNTGFLRWSSDLEAWNEDAVLPLPDDSVTKLFVGRRVGGEFMLYASTKQGLWGHDAESQKWFSTEFSPPADDNAGRGTVVWRETIYYGDHLGIYAYDPSGLSGAVVTVKGPDREDGLPLEYRGIIVDLLSSHTELIALIDATHLQFANDLVGSNWRSNVIQADVGKSAILAYDGAAWQPLWESDTQNTVIRHGLMASAYGDYRLWWAQGNKVHWMKRPRDIPNSGEVDTTEFAKSGTFISPWFDAGDIEAKNVGITLRVDASRLTATEKATISIGYDRRSKVWDVLPESPLTEEGTYEIGLQRYEDHDDPLGVRGAPFSAIRWKVDLERGDDERKTPDIHFWQLSFIKQLPQKYTYSVHVDISERHGGLTPEEQIAMLEELTETETPVRFVYQSAAARKRDKYVICTGLSDATSGGTDVKGIVVLQLLEV